MRAEHRRPLIAAVAVLIACGCVIAHAMRTDALGGLSRPMRVVAGHLLEPAPTSQRMVADAPIPTGGPTASATKSPVGEASTSAGATRARADRPGAAAHRSGRPPSRPSSHASTKPSGHSSSSDRPAKQSTSHESAFVGDHRPHVGAPERGHDQGRDRGIGRGDLVQSVLDRLEAAGSGHDRGRSGETRAQDRGHTSIGDQLTRLREQLRDRLQGRSHGWTQWPSHDWPGSDHGVTGRSAPAPPRR
jgi:hypothetical protein